MVRILFSGLLLATLVSLPLCLEAVAAEPTNRDAIEEWRGFAQRIRTYTDEMNGLFGTYEQARQTELSGFAADERVWAQGDRPNGDPYVSGESAALWCCSDVNLRAGRAQFAVPPPRVYFDQHRQAMEKSVAALHRYWVKQEDVDAYRAGMQCLAQRMDRVKDKFLDCVLENQRESTRMLRGYDEQRTEGFAKRKLYEQLRSTDEETANEYLRQSEQHFRVAESLRSQRDAADRAYRACVRELTELLEEACFSALDVEAVKPTFDAEARGSFRALMGGPTGSTSFQLREGGPAVTSVSETVTPLGSMVTRVRTRDGGQGATTEVRLVADQRAIPESDAVPAPLAPAPQRPLPPLLELEREPQNLATAPKILAVRSITPLPGNRMVLQGDFRGDGPAKVILRKDIPEAERELLTNTIFEVTPNPNLSGSSRLAFDIPAALRAGDYDIIVEIDGRRSLPYEYEFPTEREQRKRADAFRRLGEQVLAKSVDLGLDNDFVTEFIGLIYSNVQKQGVARLILASYSNEHGRNLMVYEATFNDGFKDFKMEIKLARVPRGTSDDILNATGPVYRAFKKIAPVISLERTKIKPKPGEGGFERDDYVIKVGENFIEGSVLGVRIDKENDRYVLTDAFGYNLLESLGTRLQYNEDQKSIELDFVMAEELAQRSGALLKRASFGLSAGVEDPSVGVYQESSIRLKNGQQLSTNLSLRYQFEDGRIEGAFNLQGSHPVLREGEDFDQLIRLGIPVRTVTYSLEAEGALDGGDLADLRMNGRLSFPVIGGQLGMRLAATGEGDIDSSIDYSPFLADAKKSVSFALGYKKDAEIGEEQVSVGASFGVRDVGSFDLRFRAGANLVGFYDGTDMFMGASVNAAVGGKSGPLEWELSLSGLIREAGGREGSRGVSARGVLSAGVEIGGVAEFSIDASYEESPNGNENTLEANLKLEGVPGAVMKAGEKLGLIEDDEIEIVPRRPPLAP